MENIVDLYIRRLLHRGLIIAAMSIGLAHAPAMAAPVLEAVPPGSPRLDSTTLFDLATAGYQQTEFIVTGNAQSFTASQLSSDGRWAIAPATQELYGTRFIVYRPVNAQDFSGTVYVEWMNVTNGAGDSAADWRFLHNEIIRQGAVWVGVSAQAIGANGAKAADAKRYEKISHPGDSFSYDIFDQVGSIIRSETGRALGGLALKKLIAIGESQSAGRLVSYVNGLHPLRRTFDGYLIHSRGVGAAPLSQAPLPAMTAPPPVMIRADIGVPVLVFQTETEVLFSKGQLRQPDTDHYRLWEVPGTAHVDAYLMVTTLNPNARNVEFLAREAANMILNPTRTTVRGDCDAPINSGPQVWVLSAALRHLDQWVSGKATPPKAPRMTTQESGEFGLVADADGNLSGGIRTPYLDAPFAKFSGASQKGGRFCGLMGSTEPLSKARLNELYGDKTKFLAAWTKALDNALKSGFILADDAQTLRVVGNHLADSM